QLLTRCSPCDLTVLRRVCRLLRVFLDNRQEIWEAARDSVAKLDQPGAPHGRVVDESQWAKYVFTGPVSLLKNGSDFTKSNWTEIYEKRWLQIYKKNLRAIDCFVSWECPDIGQDERISRVRFFLRLPACIILFETFCRDLKVIDYHSFVVVHDAIMHQTKLVETGDMTQFPPGYLISSSDKIVCPLCPKKWEDICRLSSPATPIRQLPKSKR
ncbi:hypothetical protein BD626DRAFT_396162, partial [Schizophyllum amplum]